MNGSTSHRFDDEPTDRPIASRGSRPPPPGARARRHPDDEALEIILRFSDRIAVARSLARMVTGAFKASATHVSSQAMRAARAAKSAALHVAAQHADASPAPAARPVDQSER